MYSAALGPNVEGRCRSSVAAVLPSASPLISAGTAAGRILGEDNVTPVPGAHLQVIGQPYSTFSGSGGQYRLTIPRKLVENCRVQYVRVSAAGYRSRLLPLSLGMAPLSDDVALSRR